MQCSNSLFWIAKQEQRRAIAVLCVLASGQTTSTITSTAQGMIFRVTCFIQLDRVNVFSTHQPIEVARISNDLQRERLIRSKRPWRRSSHQQERSSQFKQHVFFVHTRGDGPGIFLFAFVPSATTTTNTVDPSARFEKNRSTSDDRPFFSRDRRRETDDGKEVEVREGAKPTTRTSNSVGRSSR